MGVDTFQHVSTSDLLISWLTSSDESLNTGKVPCFEVQNVLLGTNIFSYLIWKDSFTLFIFLLNVFPDVSVITVTLCLSVNLSGRSSGGSG